MRIGSLALTCAAVLAFAAPALAQTAASPTAGATDPNRLLRQVTQADLVALVRSRGDTIVNERKQGGVSVLAKTQDGLLYVLKGSVCGTEYATGCLGLSFEVRYDSDSRVTLAKLNDANWQYAATKVVLGENESGKPTVFVIHYTILDNGQRFSNLKIILTNVLDVAPKVSEIIWP